MSYVLINDKGKYLIKVHDILTSRNTYVWMNREQVLKMRNYYNKEFSFVSRLTKKHLINDLKKNWKKMKINDDSNLKIINYSII